MKINLKNIYTILIFCLVILIAYFINKNFIEEFSTDAPYNLLYKNLPKGSWLDSSNGCEVTSFNPPYLSATCNDDKGKPVSSVVDLNSCVELVHTDPDSIDPSHQYMDRPKTKPDQFNTKLPHEHKLMVENGELHCDYN